jgi:hypothetical protein
MGSEAAAGRIVLTRAPNRRVDRLRSYKISIDGRRRGRIKAGERLRLDVQPGTHEIRLRMDWGY